MSPPSLESPHPSEPGPEGNEYSPGIPTGVRSSPGARPLSPAGRLRRWLRVRGVEPVVRIARCTLRSLAISAWASVRSAPADRELRARIGEASRRRIARLWAELLGSLRGAYAKAGQFAAARPDLVPEEFARALAPLRDRLPPLPLAEIRPVVEAELGHSLESAFAEFHPEPLGAASVAQVHRAKLPDGTPVAVKVQYPWLRDSLGADLKVLRGLARILIAITTRGRWRMDFERFFAEFAEGLAEELDFEAEARAASEIAANLSGDPGVKVPRVIASHTRTRVLCMTYHPSVNIADRAGLKALGVEPAMVLEIVARAYAKQIFEDGLFHADPHPGNLFVLDEEGADENPRVLFVDFGLHRRLSPELRREMRQGIFALMQRDVDLFIERMKALDMIAAGAEEGVRSAVSGMLERIAGQGGANALMIAPGDQVLGLKDEAKRLLQETPGLQLPNDLLLYAKTLTYLFALGEEIDPEVDLMKISVPYLLQFLAAQD